MPKEDLDAQLQQLTASLKQAEEVRSELDRRIFHLKTLYDVSKDIYGSVETSTILKNFLLMSMGNFGVDTGFILLANVDSMKIEELTQVGIQDEDSHSFMKACQRLLNQNGFYQSLAGLRTLSESDSFHSPITLTLPFVLDDSTLALLALGSKLAGDGYNEDDKELLYTLLNNLAVAVKNAKSFEQIQQLNKDLKARNRELKASIRKIELLESVKANLKKFVPATVSQHLEKSPNGELPQLEERHISVLFLDIEGYTGLCERLGYTLVHEIIEKHFSVFVETIYANQGDVNETAGDALMVLFMNDDERTNAYNAVSAALSIKENSVRIKEQFSMLYRPLDINIGINSGSVLVGAAKFESIAGSRWTYTARGSVVNVAARLGALATKGSIFLSRDTADLVADRFPLIPRGKFKLKNVSEKVEVFEVG
ncbi:MAG: adenylate/guanylate cyclase domain-containing protein [Deltaproteobacteria bacterium]